MSKKAVAVVAPAAEPEVEVEEGKPVVLVGLESTPKGFVVVSATICGDKVLSRQSHGPPQLKQWSAKELKKVLLAKVVFPNGL